MGDTKFDPVSDYRKSNPSSEYCECPSGESKEPSSNKGLCWLLFIIVMCAVVVFYSGKAAWQSYPDQMKHYVLDYIPWIEKTVVPVPNKTTGKMITTAEEMEEFHRKKLLEQEEINKQFNPLYQIEAITKNGNLVRVDIKVDYIVKNEGGSIQKKYRKPMVGNAVRRVIGEYDTKTLYKSNRLTVRDQIRTKLQQKYFADIIEVKILSFGIQFDKRTTLMFEHEREELIRVQRAKAEIEMAKIRQKVMMEEMKSKAMIQHEQLKMERQKKIYQAQTIKMVHEILQERKKVLDAK